MAEKKALKKVSNLAEPGLLKNLSNQAKLVLRLLKDRRVNIFVKILPIGAFIYLLSPDFFPLILDDAGVLGVGLYLFLDLCPEDVVEEHRQVIWAGSSQKDN